jgi:hypothetical protein
MAKELLGIATSGESEAVRLNAIRDALDRTIGKAPTTVEIGPTKPFETVFDSIGGSPGAESPSVATDYTLAGLGRDVADVEISSPPAQPHTDTQTQPPGHTEPRNQGMNPSSASGYEDASPYAGEQGEPSSEHAPPRQPRRRESDRDIRPQPRELHITGDAAIRMANAANRAIGAMPDQLALESRHGRYPRP